MYKVAIIFMMQISARHFFKKKSLLEGNLSNSSFDTAEILLKFYKEIFNVELKYLCDWVRSGWVLGTTLQSAVYWGKKWKNSFCLPLTVLKHFSFQNQFNFQFRTSLNTCVLLDQGCRSRGQGPMAPPDFDRSVNTNATRGHIMPPPHITDCPPPSNFQTFLRPVHDCTV